MYFLWIISEYLELTNFHYIFHNLNYQITSLTSSHIYVALRYFPTNSISCFIFTRNCLKLNCFIFIQQSVFTAELLAPTLYAQQIWSSIIKEQQSASLFTINIAPYIIHYCDMVTPTHPQAQCYTRFCNKIISFDGEKSICTFSCSIPFLT